MKKLYLLSLLCTGLLYSSAIAQRFVDIPTDASDPQDIVSFIEADTLADGSHDQNTIYHLENGAVYLLQSRLVNSDYKLRIHAKDTSNTALKPFIIRFPNDEGRFLGGMRPEKDIELINLWVVWGEQAAGARFQGSILRLNADSVKAVIKDCVFEKDRFGLRVLGNRCKVFIENTVMRNYGDRRVAGGNGRLADTRDNVIDSLVVKNSVLHNVADRIFRSIGASEVHNYVEFDHVTVFNQIGRFGGFQLGFGVNTFKVTNSIFENPLLMGNNEFFNDEQTHEDGNVKFLFSVDGDQKRVDSIGTSFTFENNNIYWKQDILDYYTSNDSVSQVEVFSQEVLRKLGGQTVADASYISEVLEFNAVPTSLLPFLEDVYEDPSSSEMYDFVVESPNAVAANPDVFANHDNVFDFAGFDIGYSQESASFTAASDGGAIGARFGSFGQPVTILSVADELIETFLVYPNPNTGPATFRYELEQPDEIIMTLTDMNGRDLGVIDSGFKGTGKHSVNVDLSKYITDYGIYFANFKSSVKTTTMRLVYVNK